MTFWWYTADRIQQRRNTNFFGMKPTYHVVILLTCLLAAGVFCPSVNAQSGGHIITVNDVGDTLDATPGDGICADAAGKCTLRAAISESNATEPTDAIAFDVPVPAVITLTLGELHITNPVGIFGRGARRLTVQRSFDPNVSNFRIFHLSAITFLRGMTI